MQSTLKDSLINEYKVQVRSADTIINNLQFANHELKEVIEEDRKELIKRRLNVYKFSIVSGVIGFVISIFVL